MLARVVSGDVVGIEPCRVHVEVDSSRGMASFSIVGLPETSVRESRVRVLTALTNASFERPAGRVVVNLAPADVPKRGSLYDLPIAIGLIAVQRPELRDKLEGCFFVAELSLSGRLRPVRGVLPLALLARRTGVQALFVAPGNADEAAAVDGPDVYAAPTLEAVVAHLMGEAPLEPHPRSRAHSRRPVAVPDIADVRGQAEARRAMLIAAAGNHNLLMIGPPGCGKTMLARRLPGILPPMTQDESLEASQVYSVCGLLRGGLLAIRPFRAPHHTASTVALVGGGQPPRPGEISLSHRGVLFLDELPEFRREALEALRQPLEEHRVVIARAAYRVEFPAQFMLVAAANPCPCGFFGHEGPRRCQCTWEAVRRYRNRLSGPLLDRIDMHVRVRPARFEELRGNRSGPTSSELQGQVVEARNRQRRRAGGAPLWNSALEGDALRRHCKLDDASTRLLHRYVEHQGLSARAMVRILRVARTIADLDASGTIQRKHLAEALTWREELDTWAPDGAIASIPSVPGERGRVRAETTASRGSRERATQVG